MKNADRERLLPLLTELGDEAPELRLEQFIANLATLAGGAEVAAIRDAEDPELIAAAERLLSRYQERNTGIA